MNNHFSTLFATIFLCFFLLSFPTPSLSAKWNPQDKKAPSPESLTKLKNLTTLCFTNTDLSGPIPSFLSKLRSLDSINLAYNNFSGPIPASLVPKSFANAEFTSLDFSRNKLEGGISFFFGKNKTLQIADFSRNLFEFNLSKVEFPNNLVFLELNRKKIFGILPEDLTKLQLQLSNVSYNRLCRKIPTGGRLQNFEETAYFHNLCLCGAPLAACK
ncbi:hypothetical protein LIER_01592 [Lithospermum erythrorhizon]|uniref:Uncharacterized protein n=1 Tax=Lithospermum erythrorhizon TaxID=34254 RepID=A0AAV3NLG9_LITER